MVIYSPTPVLNKMYREFRDYHQKEKHDVPVLSGVSWGVVVHWTDHNLDGKRSGGRTWRTASRKQTNKICGFLLNQCVNTC